MSPLNLSHIVTHYINQKGDSVSHKKLQKLLYYIEAWNMVHLGAPLIDEEFQAWVHGPVLPSLYQQLKEFGFNKLEVIHNEGVESADVEVEQIIKESGLSPDQTALIYSVLNKYGSLSSLELELLTHSEAPWIEARAGLPPHVSCNNIIPKDKMRAFYSGIIA